MPEVDEVEAAMGVGPSNQCFIRVRLPAGTTYIWDPCPEHSTRPVHAERRWCVRMKATACQSHPGGW